MIIYKVQSNYHNGIEEFEIIDINNDGTFNYEIELFGEINKRVCPFIPNYGNGATYFLKYEDAKKHITDKIIKSIKHLQHKIDKANKTLNVLQQANKEH